MPVNNFELQTLVQQLIEGKVGWHMSVIDFWNPIPNLPVGPVIGNRYIASASGNGWLNGDIYEWEGTTWNREPTNVGDQVYNNATNKPLQKVNATTWVTDESTNALLNAHLAIVAGNPHGVGSRILSDMPCWNTSQPVIIFPAIGPTSPIPMPFKNDGMGSPGVWGLGFVNGALMEAFAIFELPSGYREGTNIHICVNFGKLDGNAGIVELGCEYTFADHVAPNNVFPPTLVVPFPVNVVGIGPFQHVMFDICQIPAIPPPINSPKVGSVIMLRFYRNGALPSDTYASPIVLLSGSARFYVDTIGQSGPYTK